MNVPISKVSSAHVFSTPTIEIDDTGSSSSDESGDQEEEGTSNPKKKAHVDGEQVLDFWKGGGYRYRSAFLPPLDQSLLVSGKWLNDHHINFAQCLLRKQFVTISGLLLTLLQGKKQQIKIKSGIQIVYLNNWLHWCVASTVSCAKNEVKVYNSVFSSPDCEMRTV